MGEDVGGVEAGVVAELAGDDFEGFGEGFDDGLLFAGDAVEEVGGAVQVCGDFHLWCGRELSVTGPRKSGSMGWGRRQEGNEKTYLTGPTSSNDIPVLDSSLDNHNRIVQTPLHLGNKLLRSAPEHQRTRLRLRAALEEIEALAADLALFEAQAGAEVVGLDVGAGAGDGAAAGLDDALEVVRGDAAGAEDVAVGEVSAVGFSIAGKRREKRGGITVWLDLQSAIYSAPPLRPSHAALPSCCR